MSNLLDRASVVLTPTAYNNGEALCIKPDDASGDFQFSRNSAATRVNAQGLVENVQILSSNLVQNGDFSEEGAEEVSNGSFSQEGVQLVTNGSFDTDSNWSKQTSNWTISNGYAICDGLQTTNSSLFQDLAVVNGNSYRIDFTITDSANDLNLILGATTIGQYGDGTHTVYVEKDSGGTRIFFQATASNGFQGSIDNVSVREVGQDWTLGTGWSIGEDKVVKSGTDLSYLTQSSLSSVVGKTYRVKASISNMTTGNIRIDNFTDGTVYTSDVEIDVYYTATSVGNFRFLGWNGFNGSITNISIKEVGQNWNFNNGAAIAEDKATIIGDGSVFGYVKQLSTFVSGKKYKVTLDAIINSGGGLVVKYGLAFADNIGSITTSGSYTFYYTAGVSSSIIIGRSTGGVAYNSSVTNISVIEITDDTNLPRINYEGFSFDGSGNVVPDSGCGSWLFEPQSTNLLPYSNDFSSANWSKSSNYTVQSNIGISPDGSLNASTITNTNGSGGFVFTTLPVLASTEYTVSFYAKRGTATEAKYSIYDGGDIIPSTSYYADITDSKYTRVSFSFTSLATSSTVRFYITRDDGAVGTVYVYGAQVEQQSYATSYIPTEGSTVTRNQDVCNNGGSLASINSTEGVLYAEISSLNGDSDSNRTISLSDSTNVNQIRFYFPINIEGQIKIRVDVGGSTIYIFDYNITTSETPIKLAFRYSPNGMDFYGNGSLVSSSALVPSFTNNLNSLQFRRGDGQSGEDFFGKTKALAVWKEALSDQELTELTTI